MIWIIEDVAYLPHDILMLVMCAGHACVNCQQCQKPIAWVWDSIGPLTVMLVGLAFYENVLNVVSLVVVPKLG